MNSEIVTVIKRGWKVLYRHWRDYGIYQEIGRFKLYSRI